MLSDAQQSYLKSAARMLQIIVGALVAGLVMFALVILFAIPPGQAEAPEGRTPIITYVAVVGAIGALVMSMVIPGVVGGALQQAGSSGKGLQFPSFGANATEIGEVGPLVNAYSTKMVIRGAILEGAAFLCLVAYMMERQSLALAATGVLVLLLLIPIPTESQLSDWVESELKDASQLRDTRRA